MRVLAAGLCPVLLSAIVLLAGCRDTELSQPICTPGAVRCTETGATFCSDSGTSWIDSVCPTGEACVTDGQCAEDGSCSDVCRITICSPGERRCHNDNDYVLECDPTGTSFCYAGSCAAPPINGVCAQGACVSVCSVLQKSYLGCEYFAADLDNAQVPCGAGEFCDAAAEQFAVVVSNPDPNEVAYLIVTRGELDAAPELGAQCVAASELTPSANLVEATAIPPRGIEILELPRRDINGTVKAQLAYRIASSIPITVYQFNPLENVDVFSNDASLLLPTTAADREYYVMTREQVYDDLRGYVTIIGINDEPTEVTVTASARTLPGIDIPRIDPEEFGAQSWTTTLNKFEVLNIESDRGGADLTGTHVIADKAIVVFGGHEAAFAPTTSRCNLQTRKCAWDERQGLALDQQTDCGCSDTDGPNCDPHAECRGEVTCCADHLEQQLFPVSAWGRSYVAVRSYARGPQEAPVELDVWRILASRNGTVVSLDPAVATVPATLNAGDWFEFEASTDFTITASEPIMVGQFLVAEFAPNPGRQEDDAGIGDPAFMLAVPERQFRETYVFLAPDQYALDYVSIAAAISSEVLLDGQDARSHPVALIDFVGSSGWQSIRVPVTDGFHTLTCSEPCSVMVHGFDSFVSYGYPGGLNLLECLNDDDCSISRPFCVEQACVEHTP